MDRSQRASASDAQHMGLDTRGASTPRAAARGRPRSLLVAWPPQRARASRTLPHAPMNTPDIADSSSACDDIVADGAERHPYSRVPELAPAEARSLARSLIHAHAPSPALPPAPAPVRPRRARVEPTPHPLSLSHARRRPPPRPRGRSPRTRPRPRRSARRVRRVPLTLPLLAPRSRERARSTPRQKQ